MRIHPRRPSPALVVASLALAMATSGTAFAVTSHTTIGAPRMTSSAITNLAWSSIILQSGWAGATRTPSAAIDSNGIVHLRGAIANKTATTRTLGQLPASARPTVNIAMTAHGSRGGAVGIVLQKDTGYIILQSTPTTSTYVGLEGVTYSR